MKGAGMEHNLDKITSFFGIENVHFAQTEKFYAEIRWIYEGFCPIQIQVFEFNTYKGHEYRLIAKYECIYKDHEQPVWIEWEPWIFEEFETIEEVIEYLKEEFYE